MRYVFFSYEVTNGLHITPGFSFNPRLIRNFQAMMMPDQSISFQFHGAALAFVRRPLGYAHQMNGNGLSIARVCSVKVAY